MDEIKAGDEQGQGANKPSAEVSHTRRKAIVRMAAYTAPAMLAVLVSEKAMATSGGGGHHGGGGGWGGWREWGGRGRVD